MRGTLTPAKNSPALERHTVTDSEIVAFYRRTVSDVYRYASRLTGSDRAATDELVQDTYLAFIQRVRGTTLDVDLGWLIVTCRHRYIDRMRAEQRRRNRESRAALHMTSAVSAGGAATDAVAALPAVQRVAMVLHYIDDLPVAQVAKEMGRSVHATESLLARGREGVRKAMSPPNWSGDHDRKENK
jgi:RNA polymerase sigma-70 factor, ECF subfamily